MVQQVVNLVCKLVLVAVLCGNDHLCALLAALLEYLVDSLIEQIAGIGTLLRVCPAVYNYVVHILECVHHVNFSFEFMFKLNKLLYLSNTAADFLTLCA